MMRPMSSGNALQELVEVDHGRDLAAEIEQRQENVALTQARDGRRRQTMTKAWLAHAGGRIERRNYTCPGMTTLQLPLDYAAIERILPHRYPFLLVDRVTEIDLDRRIVGIKNVSLNERYLWHAPGQPIRSCRRQS